MALKHNSSPEQPPSAANILIVDDTPANLQLLHKMLVEQGYNVRVASSGQQAVASAQISPPDLVLLDIKMPEMDGYQVCTQLKYHPRTRHIPVIFLSVLERSFDKIKAFSVGGVDYITKPFEAEEVLARVKTHLALQTARQQLEDQNNRLAHLTGELKQEITERIQLEAELKEHRDHLEELVSQRTGELQQEIADRQQAEEALQENLQQTKLAYEQATIYAQELAAEVTRRKKSQVEREHLLKLERRQRLQAEALRRTATALSSTLNYEKVLDLILEQIELLVSPDTANIMLINGESARVLRRHSYRSGNLEAGTAPTILDIADFPLLQTIYATGQPLIVSDVTATDAWASTPETDWITSYVGVPIRVRRRVIGFLNVYSAEPDFFEDRDVEHLQSLAYQAGTAIENARLFQSVNEQGEQLRALTKRLTEVEEAERRQLARELHDQVGQNLTALSLNLKIVQTQIAAQPDTLTAAVTGQLVDRLADSLDLVEETTVRSRNVMDHLRPPALEEYGLLAALKWYVTGIQARTDIDVILNGAEPEPRLPVAIETVLFRITQEAMTNVTRHARAGRVEITLETVDDGVRLMIADDGVGFDPTASEQIDADRRQHWGLVNMVERAYAVGGRCRVDSKRGEGTRVIVEIKKLEP
jgi:signal transduction histidine kinase